MTKTFRKKYFILLLTVLLILVTALAAYSSIPAEKLIIFKVYDPGTDLENQIVEGKLLNLSLTPVIYGAEWWLEYYCDGQWEYCKWADRIVWELWANTVEPMFAEHFQFNLSYFGELKPGDYRIVKPVELGEYENKDEWEDLRIYCYFTIE